MFSCDQSLSLFKQFETIVESLYEDKMSESDTRSKLIDAIMVDVLGWPEETIIREGHVKSGFFDYKFSLPGFAFVMEAKHNKIEFVLPTGARKVKIGTIYKENKDVIDQIKSYLTSLNLDTGIITNGHQFIVAKFVNISGSDWKKNDAFLFNGFKDIESRFVDFWNSISYEAVFQNQGIVLLKQRKSDFCKSIFNAIPQNSVEISRNVLAASITPIIDKVFGKLYQQDPSFDDLGFIKECYVDSLEVAKNTEELSSIFSDDSPKLKGVSTSKTRAKIGKEISKEIIQDKSLSQIPKPIIIVGTKGAGKTTFINHFFRSDLTAPSLNNHPYVILDMMNYFSASGSSIDFNAVAKDIIVKLGSSYPSENLHHIETLLSIYNFEIKQNKLGIWSLFREDSPEYAQKLSSFLETKTSDSISHLMSINNYFISHGKRIIIAFDNADQMADKTQEAIFLFAATLNSKGKLGVIISLREGYYHTFKNKTPFDAFQSNVYHIAVPNYAEVIKKRLAYAIELVKTNDDIEDVSFNIDGKEISLSSETIALFLEGLSSSSFLDENTKIIDFIKNSSFPNIREGLRLFELFITSGYTDAMKYLSWIVYDTHKNHQIIPFHEFVQSVGLENRLYYSTNTSSIANLFYTPQTDDYFLNINILRFLKKYASNRNNGQYIVLEELVSQFIQYGYLRKDIYNSISYSLSCSLLKTDTEINDTKWTENDFSEVDNYINIAISAKGIYYIDTLANTFCYLDIVLQDTNVYDEEEFSELYSLFPFRDTNHNRDMDKRIVFMNRFLAILRNKERTLVPESFLTQFGSFIDSIYSKGLQKEIAQIEAKLEQQLQQAMG